MGSYIQGPRIAGSKSRLLLRIISALAILHGTIHAQNFAPAVDYPTQAQPLGIAKADFNNDGNIDLVVANSGSQTLTLFLGKGDGTFATPTIISLTPVPPVLINDTPQPVTVATGDFNGDGRQDIAVGFFATNVAAQILFGNGDGTFQPGINIHQSGPQFTNGNLQLTAADFNEDGKQDLAAATDSGMLILLNDGSGNFTTLNSQPFPGSVPLHFAIGDINNDGHLDIIAILSDGTVQEAFGNGNGTFQPPTTVPFPRTTSPASLSSIALGDFNNDGHLDVAFAEFGNSSTGVPPAIHVIIQSVNGIFNGNQITFTPTFHPSALLLGDFNGDGLLDIAALSGNDPNDASALIVYLGQGALSFSGPSSFSVSALPTAFLSANLTNTPALDVVTTDLNANAISVLLNHGANTLTLVSSVNPSSVFQPVTLTAAVHPKFSGSGNLSGNLIFTEGQAVLGISPVNAVGSGSVTTSSLSAGRHSLFATFGGNRSFVGGSSASITQIVDKAVPTISLSSSSNPSLFAQSVTFIITVAGPPGAPAPTGTVNLLDGSSIILSGTLDNSGKTALSTSSLFVGSHALTAQYSGDANNASASSSSVAQQVNKNASSISVAAVPNPSAFGQSVTFSVIVSGPSGTAGTPTGTVSFSDGNTIIGSSNLDASGKGTFSTGSLSVGTHSVTATYPGDSNFSGSTSPVISQIVNKASSSTALTASPNPSILGEAISLTATVTSPSGGIPTGTVSFSDGTTALGTISVDSAGKASLSISSLGVGSHSITANYSGDGNFAASSSAAVSQVVNKATSATTLTATPNPSAFGQTINLTATVVNSGSSAAIPTGMVTFADGTKTLGTAALDNTARAVLSISSLSVGAHGIIATYPGDANFSGSASSPFAETVNKSPSATALGSSPNPSVFGQSVVVTATVTAAGAGAGIPSGTVIFLDGSATIGSAVLDNGGKATLSLSSLAVGTHSITANYAGDANFDPSAASGGTGVSQVVSQSNTGILFTSSANPSVFGEQVTLTATVTATGTGGGTPSGSVTFMDGAQSIGVATLDSNGNAILAVSSLSVGTHSLSANYPGNANYLASRSTLTQTVNKNSVSITLTSAPNPSSFGQTVSFSVKVMPSPPGGSSGTAPPGGSITFSDGATTLGTVALDSSGTVSFTTSALTAGSHTITATYGGDANFSEGSSSTTLMVQKIPTGISLTTSMNPTINMSTVSFTATVSSVTGTPSGSVTLFDGAQQLGSSQISNAGIAVFSVSNLTTGAHALTAFYAGDNNFAASQSSPLAETVLEAHNTVTLTSSTNPQTVTKAVTFSAVVTTGSGGPVNSGTVTFTIRSTLLATIPVMNSSAIFTTGSLPVGSDLITASYQAGPSPGPTDNSATLTELIEQATPVVGGGGNDEDFAIKVQSDTIEVGAGSAVSTDVTLVPLNGLTGTVNLLCAGVPPASNCTIKPNVSVFDGKNPIRATVVITTTGHEFPAPTRPPLPVGKHRGAMRTPLTWLPILPIAFAGVLIPKPRSKRARILGITLLAGSLVGCGGTTFDTVLLPSNTPRGNYTLTIQATSGPLAHSAQIHLTVK